MKHLLAVVTIALAGLALKPVAAQSGILCGPRTNVAAGLASKFSETPVSIGLANNGAVIEVYASKKGTFTIMITTPDGKSCLMAAGQNWETLKARLSGYKT